ncbi:MAG: TonB-dependent receptor [Balneolaceae bacterium]|nr:MAG: TonB-dependent receptor [Balneolaceae bacterium]
MLYRLSFLIFLIYFTLFTANEAFSQMAEGRITDAATTIPLEGATIFDISTQTGTASDADGHFRLNLSERPALLRISFVGYRTVTIEADGSRFLEIELQPSLFISSDVFVNALRADDSTPMAYTNISRAEIENTHFGQDIPYLVRNSPSVVSSSDAGTGIGYTGFRIRGVDPGRINVTLNGIPLNDAESHGVFWVNMPDIASSTQSIQLQRGVGTSTHGAGAFGATMNLQTGLQRQESFGEIRTGAGAFGTRTATVHLGSGLLDSGWQFEGRLSKIESDGYINRASSDLRSFYLSGSRTGNRSLLKADIFSGQEVTYQAWNGVPEPILRNDAAQLDSYIANLFLGPEDSAHWRNNIGNRRFNEFTYSNQVDNYQQDHYQLHYSYRLTDLWLAHTSLHYTYGRGYFEQFRRNDRLSTYNIAPITIGDETVSRSDLVRRRWLDNHFYGIIFSAQADLPDEWSLTIGGGYNEYEGDHFGEVIWARFAGASNLGDRYYDNSGFKTDFNLYGKLNYYLSPSFNTYIDLQYRSVTYRFLGLRIDGVTGEVSDLTQRDQIGFFNPKAGVVYRLNHQQRVFISFSVGGKEPTRRDYIESTELSRPKPERLYNTEAGYSADFGKFTAGLNLYHMLYRDQLINTGEVNDVGNIVRENVPDSYRMGVELSLAARVSSQLNWSGHATFSRNKISEYVRFLDDFDQGGQRRESYSNVDIAFSPSVIAGSTLSWNQRFFMAELSSQYVSRQFLDNTANSARSLDAYLRHDLRASWSGLSLPGVSKTEISLQVSNLLNTTYASNGYTFGWISGGEERFFNYYFPQAERHLMARLSFQF